jgi:hypothetical protein
VMQLIIPVRCRTPRIDLVARASATSWGLLEAHLISKSISKVIAPSPLRDYHFLVPLLVLFIALPLLHNRPRFAQLA